MNCSAGWLKMVKSRVARSKAQRWTTPLYLWLTLHFYNEK